MIPHALALFMILCQFRLLAEDLVETPVFIATLIGGFVAAWFLTQRKLPPVPAFVTLALIPWIIRLFIAFPRLFVPGTAVVLDSLLLNLDRNNFVSIMPFYWASLSTYFSIRSRTFLRVDIIASTTLLLVLFCVASTVNIEAYRWPVLMIAVFAGILFLQLLALILSIPPEYRLRRKESFFAGLALFALVVTGGILFLRPFQEQAVNRGGGLLEPNLFHFDFSQVLRLESEISMNDDLVLIVKKDAEDTHILLRRYVLSGYNPKQGFFREESLDEKTHPQQLPNRRTVLEAELIEAYRVTNQEYYLVNFDSSAFIGMNEPVAITPFESWDASSFNAAYAVQSHTSEALPFELIDSVPGTPSPEALDLSPEAYAFYTEYGQDARIAAFAREITEDFENYWEKVQAIYERLKFREYRYSLKPGIAPDGDQLGLFLFQTKKGYCSYYAFAMTLLLRSLGIPARVGAGFFIDPETNTFDYYPVRSDMAHAWVEVRFPGYGWIEYDPTTENLAEGEEFRFSSGVPPELFERLMKEILDNHSRLTPKEGADEEAAAGSLISLRNHAVRFIRTYWPALLLGILCIIFMAIRTRHLLGARLSRNPRKKTVRLWNHVGQRLRLGGYRRVSFEAEAEWAQNLERRIPGIYALYQGVAAARYAPEYTLETFKGFKDQYDRFAVQYRKTLSLGRRILGWVLPPLALILGAQHQDPSHRPGGPTPGGAAGIMLGILLLSLAGDAAEAQNPDAFASIPAEADALYDDAQHAQNAELWERAIEVYTSGAEAYPEDPRFPWALGNLYYNRRLYGLAWDHYYKTEKLLPDNPDVLYRLSRTAGYLNNETVSAEYLERLLVIEPDNKDAIGNLGWMYYKLHRLGAGEQLLRAALERFGADPDFAMTLGTIYSDMFRYDDAKRQYLDAIAEAEVVGDRLFAAVAHYNLSILETRFYRFDLAFDRTNASLAAQNRASGRLARGELFLRQLNFKQAFIEYQEAHEIDTSPLSKVNLAQTYQIAGRLEEARLYAEDCLRGSDLSWMFNYGIDPVRYKRDLHEILYETYSGLAKTEGFTPYGSWQDRIQGGFREISYRFKARVHQQLFRKYSLISADAYKKDNYGDGEPHLDALIQYYNAFKSYPHRALSYLRKARDFEVALIPEADPSYDLEEGSVLKNVDLLYTVLPQFDPVWERDMIAGVYSELAEIHGKGSRKAETRDAAERLYSLNRGALRQEGIKLPVDLRIDASGTANSLRAAAAIRKAIKSAGIDPAPDRRFRLTITINDQAAGHMALCELYDGGRGINVFRRTIPLASLSSVDISAFVRALGDIVFDE
jgi:tetratricopeptide (TPR) repeat protein